jgi:hypothetical protein
MKNWRTTLMGFVAAAFLVIGPHLTDSSKPWVSLENVPAAVAVAGLGTASKDSDVTGGTRVQPSSPPPVPTGGSGGLGGGLPV